MARIRNIAMLADEAETGIIPQEQAEAVIEAAENDPTPVVYDVNKEVAAMEDDLETMSDAADTADTLEAVADQVEITVEEGTGLEPVAAEAIKILTAHLGKRHGVKAGQRIAVESFKSRPTRLQASRIAMEDLQSAAKSIWRMIVKAYEKAIEWVKKWWNKFFDGATKLKDRAEKLKKAAESKNTPEMNKKAEGKKITEEHDWVSHIQYDGDLSVKATEAAQKAISVAGKNTTIIHGAGAFIDAVTASFDKISDPKFDESLKNIIRVFSGGVLEKFGDQREVKNADGELPDGMTTWCADLYIGDKAVYIRTFKHDASIDDIKDNAGSIKIWVDEKPGFKDFHGQVEVLRPDHAVDLMSETIAVAKMLIDDKNATSKLEASQKKLKDRAAKLADKAEDDDSGDNARAAGGLARSALAASIQLASSTRSYALSTFNAYCSWVAASLAELKKKDDTK